MVNIDNMINWIQFYSERLPTVPKPAGDHKYNACCPFHQEKNPSFWFNTTNGMWKCESGCGSGNATSFLARSESISNQDAWAELCKLAGVETSEEPKKPDLPETMQHYSEAKHLPMDFLTSLGMKDHPASNGRAAYITIPYFGLDGKCVATKQRYNSKNKQRFGWDKGGTPTLYGLWREENKNAKAIVLVEGESDAQTCWFNGIPCYGVPGATNFQAAWGQSFIGGRNVYIHVEPDQGGQKFRLKTLEKLKEAGYSGKVYTFSCNDIEEGCKDPSELFIRLGDQFRAKFDPAIKHAHLEDLNVLEGMTLNEAKAAAPKEVEKLEVYSADELYNKKLEAPPVIVQGAIPAGLTVLAGAPKRGKSWLSLGLGIAVASGQPWLGMQTQRGDVLYLDLESSEYRVQSRLNKLLVGPGPHELYLSHKSRKLDDGLLEQITMWAKTVEHPALVIIDTLGRVDGEKKKGENAYQSDTRIIGSLQAFALENKLAVVCVHHLKKSTIGVTDPFELVSGSMGITGAADAVLLLTGKRGDEDTILSISGRDFEMKELVLRLDNGRWILKSTNSEEYMAEQAYLKSNYVRAVVAIAHRYHAWRGTSSEFQALLISMGCVEAGQNDVRKINSDLVGFQKKLYERESVIYSPPTKSTKGRRYIEIKEVMNDGF